MPQNICQLTKKPITDEKQDVIFQNKHYNAMELSIYLQRKVQQRLQGLEGRGREYILKFMPNGLAELKLSTPIAFTIKMQSDCGFSERFFNVLMPIRLSMNRSFAVMGANFVFYNCNGFQSAPSWLRIVAICSQWMAAVNLFRDLGHVSRHGAASQVISDAVGRWMNMNCRQQYPQSGALKLFRLVTEQLNYDPTDPPIIQFEGDRTYRAVPQ